MSASDTLASLRAIGPRFIARRETARHLKVRVEGGEHLPRRGPALLACRHFHHLYDGAALLDTLPRRLHILVALDWVQNAWTRRWMELACRMAAWPIVLRPENLATSPAYRERDAFAYVRRGLAAAADLLRRGEGLIVFPEAYPTIDPVTQRKPDLDAFLPFRGGLLTIVALAQRGDGPRVPIIPVGLSYQRAGAGWDVTVRLDAPRYLEDPAGRTALLDELSTRVRALST